MRGMGRFVCTKVRDLIKKPVYVSLPALCDFGGCGATVRMIGGKEPGGSWYCPICACAKPYAFWDFKTVPGGARFAKIEELVIELAPNACKVCGEQPECRCDRILMDGVRDGLGP